MLDPVELQVWRHLLAAVPEEMGAALVRSAFSPNIKERRDFSCAVWDERGNLAAQASHIPVHLGSTHVTAGQVLARVRLRPGDVVLLNDPWLGGTHLPDVTVLAPVFVAGEEQPVIGTLVRAHHADLGGATPGSMGPASDLMGEGLVIPPVRLVREGVLDEDLLAMVLSNTRTPREREGDLRAQVSTAGLGCRRLCALVEEYGAARLRGAVVDLQRHAARATRRLLRGLPDGEWRAEGALDGPGTAVIRVRVRKRRDRLDVDFQGTDGVLDTPFNANPAITLSAVFYVVRLLLDADVPVNSGCLAPVHVTIPEGCLLRPPRPAAVAMGNVETSQRIVDVLMQALGGLAPDRMPACSQGTMNNLTMGGRLADGTPFTFYETIAGGAGAGPAGPGASGIQTHMTNTLNTPVEALERAFPVIVVQSRLRRGSGGDGARRGGDGVVREIEARATLRATLMASRRAEGPPGSRGGRAGKPGRDSIRKGGRWRPLPATGSVVLAAGDRIRIETPGGGGYGRAARPRRRQT